MGSCLSLEGAAALPYALTDSSSFDSNMETWLHRVPGRLFLNGSSEVASLFSKKGKKGINQDAMIVWENFASRTDTIFCGVFDGHGPCGHMVAKKVRDSLPLKLSALLQLNSIREHGHENIRSSALESLASENIALMLADEEDRTSNHKDSRPDFFTTMRGPFLKAFKVMDKELKLHPSIDCYCSGTTAVTLVKQRHDLIIANVGDSRAILGTRDEDGSLIAVQLTVDLKPDLPREAERIRRCKGRIFALQNEPEVARVWLPDCNYPGLAMARAFGDVCLKEFGLISVPDISYRRLTKKDEFVVLATDGIARVPIGSFQLYWGLYITRQCSHENSPSPLPRLSTELQNAKPSSFQASIHFPHILLPLKPRVGGKLCRKFSNSESDRGGVRGASKIHGGSAEQVPYVPNHQCSFELRKLSSTFGESQAAQSDRL